MSEVWVLISKSAICGIFVAGFLAALWIHRWISILVHEFGHLTFGRLVGLAPCQMRVGSGRVARAFQLGGLSLLWFRKPFGGSVELSPGVVPSRIQHFFFVFGGPLASAGFAALLLWFANLTRTHESPVSGLFVALGWIEIVSIALNLIPTRSILYGRMIASDGYILLKAVFSPKGKFISKSRELVRDGARLVLDGRNEEAAERARNAIRACESGEEEDICMFAAEVFIAAGLVEDAAGTYRSLLNGTTPEDPSFIRIADSFASVALYQNARSLFAECEGLLRKTLRHHSHSHSKTVVGTLAGLLAERECDDEAEPLLRKLYMAGESEFDVGLSAAYLSVVMARRGNAKESRKFGKQALNLMPDHPLVKRLLS